MKCLVLILTLISSISWAEGLKIKDIQLGYGYPNTEVRVLDYSQKLRFNQYIFKMNFNHSAFPNYYLGMETNIFRNKSSLSYEQLLLVFGYQFNFKDKWSLLGELKTGWGLMHDQGNLHKTEGYSGFVLGIAGGVNYKLNSQISLGMIVNYSRQIHGTGLTNNKHNSQSYSFQSLAPLFLIIYQF